MHTSELTVWPHSIMSTKINPSPSQKWWPWSSSSRGGLKLLLPRRICMTPFQWLSFCMQFKVIDSCFIGRDDLWQKAFAISLVIEEEIWTRCFLHSGTISLKSFMKTNNQTKLHSSRKQDIQNWPQKKKLHDISRWLWLKYWKRSKTCGQTSYIVKLVSHICYIWLTVERFMYYFKWYILLTNSENMPFLQNMMTSCILCQSYWLYKVQD